MIRLAVAVSLVLASPAFSQAAPEAKDVDVGGLLKKPCDDDKKKPEAAPTPQPTPTAQAKVEAIPGLTEMEKKPAQPANQGLGALPGPMENCK